MAKSVARQLAMAALQVRIQTSLKNHKRATKAREWPTQYCPPKITKKVSFKVFISVLDPHFRFDADQDPAFFLNADLDSGSNTNADIDVDPEPDPG